MGKFLSSCLIFSSELEREKLKCQEVILFLINYHLNSHKSGAVNPQFGGMERCNEAKVSSCFFGGVVIKLENSLHPENLWENANRDELLCAIFDWR